MMPRSRDPHVLHVASVAVILKLESKRRRPIAISGGSLRGLYIADHVAFHWGRFNLGGSEHTVNGRRYDMEVGGWARHDQEG